MFQGRLSLQPKDRDMQDTSDEEDVYGEVADLEERCSPSGEESLNTEGTDFSD